MSLGQTVMRSQVCCRNSHGAMTLEWTGGTAPKAGWTVPWEHPTCPPVLHLSQESIGSHFLGSWRGHRGPKVFPAPSSHPEDPGHPTGPLVPTLACPPPIVA